MEIKFLNEKIKLFEFKPATEHSGGFDLRNATGREILLSCGETVKIPTGIAIHMGANIEEDFEYVPCAMLLPRSGLGCKGIRPRNAPGLIDADYQGEIIVCMYNDSEDDYTIQPYDKIAQLVFMFSLHPEFNVVNEFTEVSARGDGGFGSTGK